MYYDKYVIIPKVTANHLFDNKRY